MNVFDEVFGPAPERKLALSVRQPWASLIVAGRKDIENRTWQTKYRGTLYIHAAKKWDRESFTHLARHYGIQLNPEQLPYQGIIGRAMLVDIVTRSDSPWFEGPFGWVLENPETIQFEARAGQQNLFEI